MLQLTFNAIEEKLPGEKWQQLFNRMWPAYKAWLISKGAAHKPALSECVAALTQYMPKMLPTYKKLCCLAGSDEVAARFLTGYQPPAYISGCSQVVWADTPMLVRNYDYHPHLSEGTILQTAWHGKKVMGIGDCLTGLVDGMNEYGLVVSLTFGGRKKTGRGFGIPFIIRYVLEFCSTTNEATEMLCSIPSHMAYNVMVMDKTGQNTLVQLTPGQDPVVSSAPLSVNHQGKIDWHEHATFSKTLEREEYIKTLLASGHKEPKKVIASFLEKPLFNRKYNDGFGTVYTAVYKPSLGTMELHWPEDIMQQTFEKFTEESITISYTEQYETITEYGMDKQWAATSPAPPQPVAENTNHDADYWVEYGKAWAAGKPQELGVQVANTIAGALGITDNEEMQKLLGNFLSENKRRGQIPWEMLADVWGKIGADYR